MDQGRCSLGACTILTADANELVRPVQDRLPVILPPAAYDFWLDPAVKDVGRLESLLLPYDADEMIANPVSLRGNSPRHDDAD